MRTKQKKKDDGFKKRDLLLLLLLLLSFGFSLFIDMGLRTKLRNANDEENRLKYQNQSLQNSIETMRRTNLAILKRIVIPPTTNHTTPTNISTSTPTPIPSNPLDNPNVRATVDVAANVGIAATIFNFIKNLPIIIPE